MKLILLHTNADYLVGLRLPLMRYLRECGVEVVALAPNMQKHHVARLEAFGISGRPCSLDGTGLNPIEDLRSLLALRRIFVAERPDIVLTNNVKPVIFGTLAAAIAKVPRRYALVGGLGYAYIRLPGTWSFRKSLLRAIISLLYAIAFRAATGVIFQNVDDERELVSAGVCPVAKSHVVPGSGVETDEFSGSPVACPVFIMVGRLISEKGVREYLAAASTVKAKRPHWRFLLVGGSDGNPSAMRSSEIEEYVKTGIVEWPGAVEDVKPWLQKASVFVLPSYYREGVPRSTLEAMSCGLPVITTDSPGCRETVRDNRNGILVKPRDVVALSAAMIQLGDNPELRGVMGKESRSIAVGYFDSHKVSALMGDIMGVPELRC